jgi:oligoribonuclease
MFVWVDIETTGLDFKKDKILEVAFVITSDDLEPIAQATHLVKTKTRYLHKMDGYVRGMHAKSGLLGDLYHATMTLGDVEEHLIAWLDEHEVPRRLPICGSSVHFDRRFLERDMPRLMKRFSYRNIDVSSLGELTKRWNGEAYSEWSKTRPETAHRALDDVFGSIAQLEFHKGLGL